MTRKRNRKTRKTKKAQVRSKMSKRVRGGMKQARVPQPPVRRPSQKFESKTNGSATAPSALNLARVPGSTPAPSALNLARVPGSTTARPEIKSKLSIAQPTLETSVIKRAPSSRSVTPRGTSRPRAGPEVILTTNTISANSVIQHSQIERFNTLYSELQPDDPQFYVNVRTKFEEIKTINSIDSLQTFVDLLLCLAKKLKNDQEQEQEPIFITEQIYNVFNQQGRGLMSGARTKLACANVFTVDPPECTGDRAPLTKDELKGFILATIEAIRSYQPAQTQSGIESLEQRPFTNPSLQRDIQGSLG